MSGSLWLEQKACLRAAQAWLSRGNKGIALGLRIPARCAPLHLEQRAVWGLQPQALTGKRSLQPLPLCWPLHLMHILLSS